MQPGDLIGPVEVGAIAHGGHCVARYDGRVIFVRLAVPGERAIVRITQAKAGSFCRGEVIQVLQADPARIPAPCSHYGPGGCGGCIEAMTPSSLKRGMSSGWMTSTCSTRWRLSRRPLAFIAAS